MRRAERLALIRKAKDEVAVSLAEKITKAAAAHVAEEQARMRGMLRDANERAEAAQARLAMAVEQRDKAFEELGWRIPDEPPSVTEVATWFVERSMNMIRR